MTATRTREKTPRRWVGRIGIGLMLVGVAMLAYVGWQLYGTNWVAGRAQERIVEAVEQEWADGARPDRARLDGAAAVQVSEGSATALVRIPRFGADYVVPVLEGTSDEVLAAGFGHFDDTAGPGQVGNYALAAHRVTHGEPLRDMPLLKAGDMVVIETRTMTYTYVLDTDGDGLVVPFTETWVVDPLPRDPDRSQGPDGTDAPSQRKGQRLLTLTTCAELFHTDDRLIAFGHLVDRVPRTGPA